MTTMPSGDSASDELQTTVYHQSFAVSYSFPVVFTTGLFDPGNPALREAVSRLEPERRHRCLVFVDAGLLTVRASLSREIEAYARHHADVIDLVVEPMVVPGGERIKNDLSFIETMQGQVAAQRIDRHAHVLAVGGGAVLDAVGLVAATAHRGVRHIRIPTTVLAQADSAVGVKNGVNREGAKNFIGTFAPPFGVLNDFDFIEALPRRDKIAGMAEAVKVALIRDADFYTWLEREAGALTAFAPTALARLIRRSAELHMQQIGRGGDPFETGNARPLDFGHWAAHKLEALTRYQLRHGEAVAIGMALDTRYSVLAGLLEPGTEVRLGTLLERLGFRLWHPALDVEQADGRRAVLEGLREFREHLGGELTVTLIEEIGRGVEVHALDEGAILDAIAWLRTWQGTPR